MWNTQRNCKSSIYHYIGNAEYKSTTEEQYTEIIFLMHRHCKSVNFIRTEIHRKVKNSGYRLFLCCTYVYITTIKRQKASDYKDCYTSFSSQGGASDLQAHSLYKTLTIFGFVTLKLIRCFLHVKINKQKMAKQQSNSPAP